MWFFQLPLDLPLHEISRPQENLRQHAFYRTLTWCYMVVVLLYEVQTAGCWGTLFMMAEIWNYKAHVHPLGSESGTSHNMLKRCCLVSCKAQRQQLRINCTCSARLRHLAVTLQIAPFNTCLIAFSSAWNTTLRLLRLSFFTRPAVMKWTLLHWRARTKRENKTLHVHLLNVVQRVVLWECTE